MHPSWTARLHDAALRWSLMSIALVLWWSGVGQNTVAATLAALAATTDVVDSSQARAWGMVVGSLMLFTMLGRRRRSGTARLVVAASPGVARDVAVLARRAVNGPADARVSRHEAAHAVVAVALGMTVVRVTAVPPHADASGQCSWEVPDGSALGAADIHWAGMRIRMAGLLVEDDSPESCGTAASDMMQVTIAATTLATSGRRPLGYEGALTVSDLVDGARSDVARLLVEHADAIDAVTDALVDRSELTRAEVEQLTAGVRPAAA